MSNNEKIHTKIKVKFNKHERKQTKLREELCYIQSNANKSKYTLASKLMNLDQNENYNQ